MKGLWEHMLEQECAGISSTSMPAPLVENSFPLIRPRPFLSWIVYGASALNLNPAKGLGIQTLHWLERDGFHLSSRLSEIPNPNKTPKDLNLKT